MSTFAIEEYLSAPTPPFLFANKPVRAGSIRAKRFFKRTAETAATNKQRKRAMRKLRREDSKKKSCFKAPK